MKQVIVDRGVYKFGIKHANGEETKPSWESTEKGMSIVIGHENEEFQISSVNDIEFILIELNKRLKLDLPIEKFTCDDCTMEFYADTMSFEVPEYCPNCSSLNITRGDFLNVEVDE